jgi:chaperonin GroES
MKFRPLHDRVVIERIDAEAKTAGGIIIPDTAQEKPQQGKVIAVGPGGRDESGKLIPIDVKVGNRILFGKWSGTEVKIDSVEYLIMKESDIISKGSDQSGARGTAGCGIGRRPAHHDRGHGRRAAEEAGPSDAGRSRWRHGRNGRHGLLRAARPRSSRTRRPEHAPAFFEN